MIEYLFTSSQDLVIIIGVPLVLALAVLILYAERK
jgi:hypothetical protein